LDLHLSGPATALGLARILRCRQADRAQGGVGHRALRRRRGRLRGRARRLLRRRGRLRAGRRRLRGLALRGGLPFGLLLAGKGFGGFLLRLLLLGDALLLQFGLAADLLLGRKLLLLGAFRGGGAAVGDRLLQARQRRVLAVGLLEQRVQALRFIEVVAVDALLGGDQRVRQQVGQRAGHGRVVGLLVAQRQVVLHGIVAFRRVEPLLAQGLARGVAQLLRRHRGDLVGHGRLLLGGRCLGGLGPRL